MKNTNLITNSHSSYIKDTSFVSEKIEENNICIRRIQNIPNVPEVTPFSNSKTQLNIGYNNIDLSQILDDSMLNQKESMYQEYLCRRSNSGDAQSILSALKSKLSTENMKNNTCAQDIITLLPALDCLASELLTLAEWRKLTKIQRDEVNKREDVAWGLIRAFAMLPDILFKSLEHKQIATSEKNRKALTDELANSALQRLLTGQKTEAERQALKINIYEIIQAPPQSMPIQLREQIESFFAFGMAKLQIPVQEKLNTSYLLINNTIKNALHFLSKDPYNTIPQGDVPFPIASSDFQYSIKQCYERLSILIARINRDINMISKSLTEIKKKADRGQWLEPGAIRLSVPSNKVVNSIKNASHQIVNFIDPIKRFNQSTQFIPRAQLISFDEAPRNIREWCLTLKEMSTPVQKQAIKLQQTVQQLNKVIKAAKKQGIKALPIVDSAETAVLTELLVLTDDSPQTQLILAIQAARNLAPQEQKTPDSSPQTSLSEEKAFSCYIEDFTRTLEEATHTLNDTLELIAYNLHQQSITERLNHIVKIAEKIQNDISYTLESSTGVSLHSSREWLDEQNNVLLKTTYVVTRLISKSLTKYPSITSTAEQIIANETHFGEIHQSVLPMLNQVEKIRAANRILEITLPASEGKNTENQRLKTAIQKCRHIALNDIREIEASITQTLDLNDIYIYQQGDEYNGHPTTLSRVIKKLSDELLETAERLQITAGLVAWSANKNNRKIKLALTQISQRLDKIKAEIKDVIWGATGTRLHNNTLEGMIAKDAGEWLAVLRKEWDGKYTRQEIDKETEQIIRYISKEFASEDDPEGQLFKTRIMLALRDAEGDGIPWPLTAEEHLGGTKANKAYIQAWAEKRLTYSMLYNFLIHGSTGAIFSLCKSSLVSPLRLLNLLLTPVRMKMTRRTMEKVRPGNPRPSALIAEYESREIFQAAVRLVSMLSPQLPKTVAAFGLTAAGMVEGGSYREEFLKRAVSRLPGDLFWVSGFAAWKESVQAYREYSVDDKVESEQIAEIMGSIEILAGIQESSEDESAIEVNDERSEEDIEPIEFRSEYNAEELKAEEVAYEANQVDTESHEIPVLSRLKRHLSDQSLAHTVSSGEFNPTDIIDEAKDIREEINSLAIKIDVIKKDRQKINNTRYVPIYKSASYVEAAVNAKRAGDFNQEKKGKLNKLDNQIKQLKNNMKACEEKLQSVLEPALEWYLKTYMGGSTIKIDTQETPSQGTIIHQDDDEYIYLFDSFWRVEYTDNLRRFWVLKEKYGKRIRVENIGKRFVLSCEIYEFELYLTDLIRIEKEHKNNIKIINELPIIDPELYLSERLKGTIKTDKGESTIAKIMIFFNIENLIKEISNGDACIYNELSTLVSQCNESDSSIESSSNGLTVKRLLILIQSLSQYSSNDEVGENSKAHARKMIDKIKTLTKNVAFDHEKIIYNFLEDYIFIVDESQKIQPENEWYKEAINTLFFKTQDPFTRKINELEDKKRYLLKTIAAKIKMRDEELIDTKGPRLQLSMNYSPPKITEKYKELDDEIYEINKQIKIIDGKMLEIKNDTASRDQYNEICNFIKRMYYENINNNIFSYVGKKLLLSRNISDGKESDYYQSRAKVHHIQMLLQQSSLYKRLYGLFNNEDFKKIDVTYKSDYSDIENAKKFAKQFIDGTLALDSNDEIHIQAIFYYIIKHKIKDTEELLTINPQPIFYEYVTDSRELHPIKIEKQPNGYISKETFFFREQFNSQSAFNDQFNQFKTDYAHYEASVIGKRLYDLMPDAPQVSDLYEKPKWVKEFGFVEQTNDRIYVFALNDGRFIVVSYINNIFSAKIHQEKDIPSFFLRDPLEVVNKKNHKVGTGIAISTNSILTSEEIDKFENEFRSFMTNHQKVGCDSNIKIQSDDFAIKEKNVADSFVAVIESSIQKFVEQQKVELDKSGFMHEFAKAVCPFYDTIYTEITDSGHEWTFKDTLSIINDTISFILFAAEIGVKINETVAKDMAKLSIDSYLHDGNNPARFSKTLNKIKLQLGISKTVTINTMDYFFNPLPFSPHDFYSSVLGGIRNNNIAVSNRAPINIKYAASRMNENSNEFISLKPMESQNNNNIDIFKGVYLNTTDGNYYIFSNSQYYQVRWSEVENTWRLVDPKNSGIFHWTPAVKLDKDSEWNMYFGVDLKGGGWVSFNKGIPMEISSELRTHSELPRFNSLSKQEKIAESIKKIKSKDYQYEYFFDLSDTKKRLNLIGHVSRNALKFQGDLPNAKVHSPQEIAALILPIIKANNISEIRLISCWAGKNGYAQELANILNIPVKGAMGKVSTLEVMPGRFWFLQRPFNATYPEDHKWKMFYPINSVYLPVH